MAKIKRRTSPRRRRQGPGIVSALGRTLLKALESAGALRVAVVIAVVVALVAVMALLERYLDRHGGGGEAPIVRLVNVPFWVTERLMDKVTFAARIGVSTAGRDRAIAFAVQSNIEREVPWLANVRVKAAHDAVVVDASWRRPVAVVATAMGRFYIDRDMVVLDYLPVKALAVVEISGAAPMASPPPYGSILYSDDLAAAVALLDRFAMMDSLVAADKPLLEEISTIDVSNFRGREGRSRPHMVLYASDRTEIIWGAELGGWQRCLEAPDDDKLARLYAYYRQYGTVLDGARYIDLRGIRDDAIRPADRF